MICGKCAVTGYIHCSKVKNYYVIFGRLIAFSTYDMEKHIEDSEEKFETCQKKKKIAVLTRIFPANGQEPTAKGKLASSVIKKLNWENKYLFGPLQVKKRKIQSKDKLEFKEIIQHKTQIPILDSNVKPDTEDHKCLDYIENFPLLNKSQGSYKDLSNNVEKANIMRNYLEHLSIKTSFPSVSCILEKTMPSERVLILKQWKQNMINDLGEEGFKKYQSELLENGSSLHSTINTYLTAGSDADLVVRDENFGHWRSLKEVLPLVKNVKLLEEHVFHPFLCYRGVIDCFATYRDHLVVIDWKTSKKSKTNIKSLYDNPLQIAAYVGALNFDPRFQYLVSKGLVVVAYETGIPATVHFIGENTMREYWNQWLKRVTFYWENVISTIS